MVNCDIKVVKVTFFKTESYSKRRYFNLVSYQIIKNFNKKDMASGMMVGTSNIRKCDKIYTKAKLYV